MIPKREILELRNEWQLDVNVIEKDYVLGWLLAAIALDPDLTESWIFKGGTALRKCYYETYRFSEDLDFTIAIEGPDDPEILVPIFERIGASLYDTCGIELVPDESTFRRRQNRRGNPTTEGRIAFRGPLGSPVLAKVKLDLTKDELIALPAVNRRINHPYSDEPDGGIGEVRCYTIVELLAEKLRALAERCRPRDLYDVVNVHRHADVAGLASRVSTVFREKCVYVGIPVPTAASIGETINRSELELDWERMLGHQLPFLPPFGEFWDALNQVFDWLERRVAVAILPRAEIGRDVDPAPVAPRMMTTWRARAPLELIRFAGVNRLKIEIDYRAEQGRQGPRIVEPLSFRRTLSGDLLLYVLNDHRLLRSYRVDRIAGVRVTNEPFSPVYRVEF